MIPCAPLLTEVCWPKYVVRMADGQILCWRTKCFLADIQLPRTEGHSVQAMRLESVVWLYGQVQEVTSLDFVLVFAVAAVAAVTDLDCLPMVSCWRLLNLFEHVFQMCQFRMPPPPGNWPTDRPTDRRIQKTGAQTVNRFFVFGCPVCCFGKDCVIHGCAWKGSSAMYRGPKKTCGFIVLSAPAPWRKPLSGNSPMTNHKPIS